MLSKDDSHPFRHQEHTGHMDARDCTALPDERSAEPGFPTRRGQRVLLAVAGALVSLLCAAHVGAAGPLDTVTHTVSGVTQGVTQTTQQTTRAVAQTTNTTVKSVTQPATAPRPAAPAAPSAPRPAAPAAPVTRTVQSTT